jgi:hypothetical protein
MALKFGFGDEAQPVTAAAAAASNSGRRRKQLS